jgi:hypothetical protein
MKAEAPRIIYLIPKRQATDEVRIRVFVFVHAALFGITSVSARISTYGIGARIEARCSKWCNAAGDAICQMDEQSMRKSEGAICSYIEATVLTGSLTERQRNRLEKTGIKVAALMIERDRRCCNGK